MYRMFLLNILFASVLLVSVRGEDLEDINLDDITDTDIHVVDGDAFNQRCLDAHNTIREMHNIAPLTLNTDLIEGASAWAKTNLENNYKPAKHAPKAERKAGKFGENIFSKADTKVANVENAVLSWYNEHQCWDYEEGQRIKEGKCKNMATGHLTQEIWAKTDTVACGLAFQRQIRTVNGRDYPFFKTYVVARYNPPGNRKKSVSKNVLPPDDDVDLPDTPADLIEDTESAET